MIAHSLLYLGFSEISKIAVNKFANMTAMQQGILIGILSSRRCWRFSGNMSESLLHFGLPETRQGLQEYCTT